MFDLALKKTLDDYEALRDDVLANYREINRCVQQVSDLCLQIGPHVYPFGIERGLLPEDQFTKELDRRIWHHLFHLTGLTQFMDAQAVREFKQTLEHNPPAFTADNARSALVSTAAQAETLFARGLVAVFRGLSKHYRTHTDRPFEIGHKVVLSDACDDWGSGRLHLSYHVADTLNDIDRVFKTLDGQPFAAGALRTAIDATLQRGQPFEDAYYKATGYKAGTLHLVFKRADLLDKANRVIHDYYQGRALADATITTGG